MGGYLGFGIGCCFFAPSLLCLTSMPSYAVSPPEKLVQAPNSEGDSNRDRLIQPGTIPQPLPLDTEKSIQPNSPPESRTLIPAPTNETVYVEKVEVTGSTIFTQAQLNAITKLVTGRSVTPAELGKVADEITQLYLDRGYINSRAILINQTITQGIVQIQVIEGGIEKIQILGTKRLSPNYVRSRIALGVSKPLSISAIEEQLKLLKSDPLIANIEPSLSPGKNGQNILLV